MEKSWASLMAVKKKKKERKKEFLLWCSELIIRLQWLRLLKRHWFNPWPGTLA